MPTGYTHPKIMELLPEPREPFRHSAPFLQVRATIMNMIDGGPEWLYLDAARMDDQESLASV